MGGRRLRLRRFIGGVAIGTAIALAAAACVPPDEPGGGGPTDPGGPDDPPPPSDVVEIDVGTLFPNAPATLQVTPGTAHIVGLTELGPGQLENQCFKLGGEQMCLGGTAHPSVLVQSEATTERLLKGGDAVVALQWMADEAAQAIAALYDVPADVRVERFARPEIRNYMVSRFLDILDKASYGKPLTDDEQRALEFLQRKILDDDRVLTTYAHQEHQRFLAQGCAYVPPAAPSYVESPVGMPQEWLSWCAMHGVGLGAVFAPPLPSVDTFQTWASYRAAAELGLLMIDSPLMRDHLAAAAQAGTFVGGAVFAAGAGVLTAKLIGLTETIGGAIAAVIHPMVKAKAVAATLGASSAGALVSTVLLAVATIGIAVWQLVEREQIGTTLTARMNAARDATDPFGLAAMAQQNQGRNLEADRESWTEETLPRYRKRENVSRLTELLVRWTTVRPNGEIVADPSTPWPSNETRPDDVRFRVSVDGGPETTVDELDVPVEGGTSDVRFSDDWAIVTDRTGRTSPDLTFEFVDPDGKTLIASRRTATDGSQEFAVVDPELGPDGAEITDRIRFRNAQGQVVTVRLVGGPSVTAVDLRPGIFGQFLPGVVLRLSPNPVDDQGFNRLPFVEDYTYDWTVQRFDDATGQWVPQSDVTPAPRGDNERYDAYFRPTTSGRHRAVVVMRHDDGMVDDLTGVVEFTVAPPPMTLRNVVLTDEAWNDQLRLSLQVLEDGASDQVDVEVQWPGELGSNEPGPTSTRTDVDCMGSFPCATSTVTFLFPTEPSTDLRGEVRVTVTNSHGGSITQALQIDAPWRPAFAEPPPLEEGQSGTITFDSYVTHLSVPVWDRLENPNYAVATIEPGYDPDPNWSPTYQLVHPVTRQSTSAIELAAGTNLLTLTLASRNGVPVVTVRNRLGMDGIGTYSIPVIVRQSNGAESTLILQVDVVPAPGDRYRVGIRSDDIDPDAYTVQTPPDIELFLLGGRAEWGAYDGDLCVGLKMGWDEPEYCAHVSTFFEPDGSSKPFPYHLLAPDGMGPGPYNVRAWLPESDHAWGSWMELAFLLLQPA